MSIISAVANSFKAEAMGLATHANTDVFKAVLIKAGHTGTYNASTAAVGTPGSGAPSVSNVGTDAVAASGDYSSVGGITLASPTGTLDVSTGILSFAQPATLNNVTASADGMVIYNSSKGNKVVATVAFAGGPITSTNGPFVITLPAATAAAGLVRFGP